ncbi:unnamed protein product [Paramecium sonneborni]|uniref:Uncharacterized protein n=1 Tax=Paramecium sonneborni TaxID=65129 RepID=A0A8S1PUD6_9CILI|nr:unnamed protein product [Paramecium sonneborni]
MRMKQVNSWKIGLEKKQAQIGQIKQVDQLIILKFEIKQALLIQYILKKLKQEIYNTFKIWQLKAQVTQQVTIRQPNQAQYLKFQIAEGTVNSDTEQYPLQCLIHEIKKDIRSLQFQITHPFHADKLKKEFKDIPNEEFYFHTILNSTWFNNIYYNLLFKRLIDWRINTLYYDYNNEFLLLQVKIVFPDNYNIRILIILIKGTVYSIFSNY